MKRLLTTVVLLVAVAAPALAQQVSHPVNGPASSTVGHVMGYGNTTGNQATDIPAGTSGNSTIVETDAGGHLVPGILPTPGVATLGGVQSLTAPTHQVFNGLSTGGVFQVIQLGCGDLSNSKPSCSTDTTNASNITSGVLPVAQDPIGANLVYNSTGNPTGTTSGSCVMMGQGVAGKAQFTPTKSGTVLVAVTTGVSETVANTAVGWGVYYGTPASGAPANGAALTGTAIGYACGTHSVDVPSANVEFPLTAVYVLTGLVVNTSYWFDVPIAVVGGAGTAALSRVSIHIQEF